MIRASVAMAVYNGEKYIYEQINSIIKMLGENDEVVISDDGSNDETLNIIKEFFVKDYRIKLYINNGIHGVSANFTNAIRHCTGKYIFLSDQDDIWLDNKIDKIISLAQKEKADLVIHNGRNTNVIMQPYGKNLFKLTNATTSPLKNYIRGRFLGCCMCFDSKTMKYILPFPNIINDIPHDIFATILVGLKGKIVLLDEILIYHRKHGGNVTPEKPNRLVKVFYNRLVLLGCVAWRMMKYSRKNG